MTGRLISIGTIILAVIVFIALVSHCSADALDALDPSETSIIASINGQNGDQVTAVAGSMPLDAINGFANGYISRQVAGGMVTSEVLYGRVQGAYDFANGMSLEAFYTATRDKWRGIALQNRVGWFYRPGITVINGILVSGGIGTFSQNQELLVEIGKEQAGENTIEFGPLAFVTGKWKNVVGKVQMTSNFSLGDREIEASASVSEEISDGIEVGITGKIIHDQAPAVEDNVHKEYMLFMKIVL